MEKLISRRSFLKKSTIYVLGLAAVAVSTPAYASYGERFWLKVNHIELSAPRLPKAFKGLRIVQFSDVHLGHYYNSEDLLTVVKHINKLDPDIIFFTGDLVEGHSHYLDTEAAAAKCISVISQLTARLGKWAVLGNHDHRAGYQRVLQTLERSGFAVLMNEHHVLEQDGQRIYIAGVRDVVYSEPDVKLAISGIPDGEFIMLLVHEPDYADTSSLYPIDFQFSGHSHGGQIRLPLIGKLLTPAYAKKYTDGLYQLEGSRMQVYVNRGIGTTLLPFRLFCRPEITLFEL